MKMKFLKIHFVFPVLMLLAVNVFAQVNSPWKWVHPTPQGNTLRYVKTFNATTHYALGYAGTFLKTTNSGTNWFINHNVFGTQANDQIYAYSGWFFDQNTGLAGGCPEFHRGCYHLLSSVHPVSGVNLNWRS